jgi:replication factor C large subunit
MLFCEKHRPECFADIKGQDMAVAKIKDFMANFPAEKAIILYGPTGSGKTSLVYALAQESKSEILELNASDLRNKEEIDKIVKGASQQASLFSPSFNIKSKKIILVDEVDGLTTDDRGGLPELIKLIEDSSFPIIITANDVWDRKFSDLRKKADLIELKELNYLTILDILKSICQKENCILPEDLLKNIAIKSKGDVRAALNDLQTINQETTIDGIDERDKEEKIFNVLKNVFKNLPNTETLFLYEKLNMPLDEVFLWLEENLPLEYKGKELYLAFNALSKADVFRGRIYRQQHWRFLIYQNFLLSAGVASAKTKPKSGFTSYQKPSRILKIWMINQKNLQKKAISEKIAGFLHISKRRAKQDFPILKAIIKDKPETLRKLGLEAEEIEFIRS